MACCSEDAQCSMHETEAHHGAGRSALSQAEADGCCALSQGHHSPPPVTPAAFPVTLSLASPQASVVVQAQESIDLWRAQLPTPSTAVPRHLLLSVFLI